MEDFCPCNHRGVSASSFRDGAIRLGTPTFKLARPKNKTGFAQRPQSAQREDSCERTGNTLGTPDFSPARLLGTPTFKLACLEKERQPSGSRYFVSLRGQPAGYPAITPTRSSRRKRFFFSRRRDALSRGHRSVSV